MNRMDDLISRQAAIDALDGVLVEDDSCKVWFKLSLQQLPSAERRGRWLPLEGDGYADGEIVYDVWECSCCGLEERGEDVPYYKRYCSWCGARMEAE